MSVDRAVFEFIYSLNGNALFDQTFLFMAEYLVFLIPLSILFLWFQDRRGKEDALFTTSSTVAGIMVSYLMGVFYMHENPSAVYDTLVSFHPENSFPSQHTASMIAATFPLLKKSRKKLGWLMTVSALLTGFSRIYIGEHWPVDILGSLFAAFLGFAIVCFSWERVETVWRSGLDLYENVEEKLFSHSLEIKER